MKKIIFILLIHLAWFQAAHATNQDNCYALYSNGQGELFVSNDNLDLKMRLYYLVGSTGISGTITQTIKGKAYQAPLKNSHCSFGRITLVWDTPSFSGDLTGYLEINEKNVPSKIPMAGAIKNITSPHNLVLPVLYYVDPKRQ